MAILLSDSYKVINWDLNTKSLDTKYWGKVTDSGRGCKVALLQNGVLKTPSTETMRINFKKPSGLQIFLDGAISGNYFVFDFTEQVFAEQGEVMAELMLNVGGEWLMSSTFYIQVDQSFTSAIESSSEFTALQTALSDVDEVKNDINELVTKTTLIDITSSVTLNSSFTLLSKRATLVGKSVTLRIIAIPNIAMGAGILHNLGSIASAYKPSTIDCNTCGCLQDGNFLFKGGALVVIKADTGAINVSSDTVLTSKYIQFSVTYDIV